MLRRAAIWFWPIVAIALVAVAVAVMMRSQERPQAQAIKQPTAHENNGAGQQKQEPNAGNHIAGDFPPLSYFLTSEGLQRISAYCAEEGEPKPTKWLHEKFICEIRSTDLAIAGFTGVLVVATFLLFGVTGLLWWSTRRLVLGAEESARRELRAYVSVTPKALGNLEADQRASVDCVIFNHGRTPASQINHVFELDILPNPLPAGFVHPAPTRRISDDFTLFPQVEMTTWFNAIRPFNGAEIAAIRLNNNRLHIWGETFYYDVFGERWSTKFNGSAGGADLANCLDAAQRGDPHIPDFRWTYGAQHGQAT